MAAPGKKCPKQNKNKDSRPLYSILQYPIYYHSRTPFAYIDYETFERGATSGTRPIGAHGLSVIASHKIDGPTGTINSSQIEEDAKWYVDHKKPINDWNLVYANILIHEIFYHGILGYYDYYWSKAPDNSLGNRDNITTKPIGMTNDEINTINTCFGGVGDVYE